MRLLSKLIIYLFKIMLFQLTFGIFSIISLLAETSVNGQYLTNSGTLQTSRLTKAGTSAAAYQVKVDTGTINNDQRFSYDAINKRITLTVGSTLYCVTTTGLPASDVSLEQCTPIGTSVNMFQKWLMLDVQDSNAFALRSQINMDLCLDTKAGSTAAGSLVSANPCSSTVPTQRWFPQFSSCQAGQQPNSVFSGCEACPVDTFKDRSGYFTCSICPANGVCSSPSASFKCESGFGKNALAGTCDACVAGQTYRNDVNVGNCKTCPAGPGMICASTSALTCSAGYQWNANKTNCELCADSFFKSKSGNETCSPCPAGQSSVDAARLACQDCPDGYYRPNMTTAGCLKCPNNTISCSSLTFLCDRGYGFNSSSQTCDKCAVGSVKSQPGNYACVECQAGYQSDSTGSQCTPCPDGKYRMANQQSACQPCPPMSNCVATGFQCNQGYGWNNTACILGVAGSSTLNNNTNSLTTVFVSKLPKVIPALPTEFSSAPCPSNYNVNATAALCILSGYAGAIVLPDILPPYNSINCYKGYNYNAIANICEKQGAAVLSARLPLVYPTFPCPFCDRPSCPAQYLAANTQICLLRGIGGLSGSSAIPTLIPPTPCLGVEVCITPSCPISYQFNATIVACQNSFLNFFYDPNAKMPRMMPSIPCPPNAICTAEVHCPIGYNFNSVSGFCETAVYKNLDNSISLPPALPALECTSCQTPSCYVGYVFSQTQNLCVPGSSSSKSQDETSSNTSSQDTTGTGQQPLKILSTPCQTPGCTLPSCPNGYHLSADRGTCDKDSVAPIQCQTGQACIKPTCVEGYALNVAQTSCDATYRPAIACPAGLTCTTPLCAAGYQYVSAQNTCGLKSVVEALLAATSSSKSATASAVPTDNSASDSKSLATGSLEVGWILFIVLVSVIVVGLVSFFGWRKYRGRRQSVDIVQQDSFRRSNANPIYSSQTNLNSNMSRSASNNSLGAADLNRSSSRTFYGNR